MEVNSLNLTRARSAASIIGLCFTFSFPSLRLIRSLASRILLLFSRKKKTFGNFYISTVIIQVSLN